MDITVRMGSQIEKKAKRQNERNKKGDDKAAILK